MTTVRVRFIGEDQSLGRTVQEVETKSGRLSGVFTGLAAGIGAALGTALPAVASFASGTIDKAADVGESLSKVNTVFGDSGAAIEEWASSAAGRIGLAKGAALDAAGTFGNMFTQLGIGTGQAADMSTSMGNLAADFASFHNADITDVLEAQTSAFRGEYDALQRFVPTINAAKVEQEALRQTGKATTKELTDQEKALAVYSLMMEGAGAAAGDFERTSDSLTNKQRIQAAQWENMQVAIGQKLIPVKMFLVDIIMNRLLPGLSTLRDVGASVVAFIQEYWEYLLVLVGAIVGALLPALFGWLAAQWALVAAQLASAAAFIAANASIILIAAAIAALVAGIIYAYQNWDWFRNVVDGVAHFLRDVLWPVFKAIAGWIIGTLIPTIISIGTHAWNFATDVYNAIEFVISFLWGIGNRVWDIGSSIWEGLYGTFKNVINAIIGIWNSLDFGIPGFKIPGIGGWGGISDVVPDIPYLDTGGIIRKQTLAMVHPDEAVVPLPRDWRNGGLGGNTIIIQTLAGHPVRIGEAVRRVVDRGDAAGVRTTRRAIR